MKRKMLTSEYSRREFLRTLSFGGAAMAAHGFKTFEPAKYIPTIGLQLYTMRKVFVQDFEGTIKKIAETGFVGVETFAMPEQITLARAGKAISEAGLKVIGCHCNLPIGGDRDVALKMAEAYGADRLIFHGWPPGDKYKNGDQLKHTVEVYNEISSALKSQGLKFGLHNHWFEFEKNDESVIPFYYFLKNVNPDIFFEIDTYWTKTGGQDPVKILTDFGKRAPLLHIKDGAAQKGTEMNKHVPAGEGTLDFPGIVKAGGKNIEWMIVEFDEYEHDIFEGIQKSYAYLTKNGLAKGKV